MAIRSFFSPPRHAPPVAFSSPSIPSAYARAVLRRNSSTSRRISRNRFRGTATSANWNVTYRPWRTTLAPILISFSRKLVCDQGSTYCCGSNVSYGSQAEVQRKPRNVRSWGSSGSRFRATGGLFVAKKRHTAPIFRSWIHWTPAATLRSCPSAPNAGSPLSSPPTWSANGAFTSCYAGGL